VKNKQPLTDLVTGFLNRDKLSQKDLAATHRLVTLAVGILENGQADLAMLHYLESLNLSPNLTNHIYQEAIATFEEQISLEVILPPSAQLNFNYYFILGTTPISSMEDISRAYRNKIKEIHPDNREMLDSSLQNSFSRILSFLSDAHDVLSNPKTRRAYDITWREKTRRPLEKDALLEGRIPDNEGYSRWEMAELSQLEEQIVSLIQEFYATLKLPQMSKLVYKSLFAGIEEYEGQILNIRTATYSFPAKDEAFAEVLRQELIRKESFIQNAKKLLKPLVLNEKIEIQPSLPQSLIALSNQLEQVRRHHILFDIKPLI
jgi:curved DNA-binding protein CbpA